jgi:hypothetical protein
MNICIDSDEENVSSELLKEKKINAVMENIWKFNQTYKISTEKMVA